MSHLLKLTKYKSSGIVIIRLMLSLLTWPKVITPKLYFSSKHHAFELVRLLYYVFQQSADTKNSELKPTPA